MVASKCSQNYFIFEKKKKKKKVNHASYISFKIAPLCNYTLLPATVKVWQHSWKAFCESLFSSSIALCQYHNKCAVPAVLISVEGTDQNQPEPDQKSMG